ncbi:hypothetical protein BOX15_Mlig019612g1 [Macrostomum lignano]|uniref:FERM domain-containing protein n=1 Tax=Macrostomum lignano TaxID=282301 RepID=A0A267DJ46_9PLAT|nr:hypothetical protein BOX15_Mlig019612g1 [Macrostomum lignano]
METLRRIFGLRNETSPSDLKKSGIECIVQCLDEGKATINLPKTCLASELYDRVYKELDFQCEHDYFALQFTDFHGIRHWLDPTKELRRQITKRMPGPPFTFRFLVKFYSSEPDNYLKEELTRYLFVLQLRSDIRDGRLVCRDEAKAAELAALVIQAEEDDYDPLRHTPGFVSQFKFLPDRQQTEAFELRVLDEYRKLANRNLSPALCERMYLSKVKNWENYGVDMHTVSGKDGRTYHLGLTPAGILVYDRQEKIGLFFWPRIIKIDFNRSKLKIVVTEDDNQGAQQDHVFVFNLADTQSCKHLWRCAVEHHSFFRLVETRAPPTKAKQLLRMRSRFYHSFRTESGLVRERQFGTSQRRSARFERRPSTRHSTRPSFARADAERRFARAQERQEAKLATLERVKAEEDGQAPMSAAVHQQLQQQFRQESERTCIKTTAMVSPQPRDPSSAEAASVEPAAAGASASRQAVRSNPDREQKAESESTVLVSSNNKSNRSSTSSSSSSASDSDSGSESESEEKKPLTSLEPKNSSSAPSSALRPASSQPQSASSIARPHPQSATAAFKFDAWSPTPVPAAAAEAAKLNADSQSSGGSDSDSDNDNEDVAAVDGNEASSTATSSRSSAAAEVSTPMSPSMSPLRPTQQPQPPPVAPRRGSGIRPPAPVPGFVAKQPASPPPSVVATTPAAAAAAGSRIPIAAQPAIVGAVGGAKSSGGGNGSVGRPSGIPTPVQFQLKL